MRSYWLLLAEGRGCPKADEPPCFGFLVFLGVLVEVWDISGEGVGVLVWYTVAVEVIVGASSVPVGLIVAVLDGDAGMVDVIVAAPPVPVGLAVAVLDWGSGTVGVIVVAPPIPVGLGVAVSDWDTVTVGVGVAVPSWRTAA